MDPLAVEEYFALGYVPEPRTIFTSAAKLPPGHSLTVRRGAPLPAPHEYWDVAFTGSSTLSAEQASAELIERLRESVRLRMISEVPLGAFLSGGVDSSAVVAMMAGISADADQYVLDIVFRFAVRRVEVCAAGRAALPHPAPRRARRKRRFRSDRSARAPVRRAVRGQLRDPTYRVCQLARKHVTVALSGDGGDESFAGYRRYRMHMMEERMRQPLPLDAAPARVRAAGSHVSEGRLGAARVARQDHIAGARA